MRGLDLASETLLAAGRLFALWSAADGLGFTLSVVSTLAVFHARAGARVPVRLLVGGTLGMCCGP